MTIGEKIKELRTSKMMTQRELAGAEITRNMLSRIENGAAQPSLDTLQYLAKRLNVSAGYLLSDAADERLYKKREAINGIKTSYLTGDYRLCRDICLDSGISDDDEVKLILAECACEIGTEEFSSGNLHAACERFDESLRYCAETIYNTERIAAVCAVYFCYMREISATLSSNVIDETDVPICCAMNDPFCIYAADFVELRGNGSAQGMLPTDREDPYSLHLFAVKCMSGGEYRSGYDALTKIIVGDAPIPEPMMYFVFCDYEICCRETGEYKGAYEYSMDKIQLLQRLLS